MFLLMVLLMAAGCNKDLQHQLDELQGRIAELQATVGELPEAGKEILPDNGMTFDRSCYWVDAAGSVTVHYSLESPADIEVST